MAEMLLRFNAVITHPGGGTYVPRVCGREAEDGLWDGWIEFDPAGGGATLRTPLETRQPNRRDLEYWATGLTVAYLEGALQRALDHRDLPPSGPDEASEPAYDSPAPASTPHRPATGARVRRHAILDPYHVYEQGEDVLRRELSALDATHIENILIAYGIGDPGSATGAIDRSRKIEAIVAAARRGLQ
jgi:hypothetical protein